MRLDPSVAHLLRRAGFGVGAAEVARFSGLSYRDVVAELVDFESTRDDVDARIGSPECLRIISREGFRPSGDLVDAMQYWLFRMVHSARPLEERMTLFWHNHFATGRSKISETFSFPGAIRAFAARSETDPDGAVGQIELFRRHALGNFRDLLLAVSHDPAMIAWLDGHANFKGRQQENYARELMELFTIGVDSFTEEDVYAAARVFTGWNLQPIAPGVPDVHYRGFQFNGHLHDTEEKTFSFPIYADGRRTIPARDGFVGYKDGLDLIEALAAHPATGGFLARKLYAFFVNETAPPDPALLELMVKAYYASRYDMREVVRAMLLAPQFIDPANHWARIAWPVELVVRALKEVGPAGFPADIAVYGMIGMGQALFDPPSVGGWRTGRAWFSTTTMLARMNFAMALCWSDPRRLLAWSDGGARSAAGFLASYRDRLSCKPMTQDAVAALSGYLASAGPWRQDEEWLAAKAAGLVHLITASGEYQFV